MASGPYPWGKSGEEKLWLGHWRFSQSYQMSKQHSILDLHLRPCNTVYE